MQARPTLARVTRRPEEVRTPGERFNIRRMVVSRNDRLGDVVLTLPCLAALRETYPKAWLTFLVRPSLRPLAEMIDGIDEILVDPGPPRLIAEALRKNRADLVVSVAPGARVPWGAMSARIPHRLGPGYRFYSPILGRRVDEHRRRAGRHEVEYALSYAHRAGAPGGPARFPIRVPRVATESLTEWLALHRIEPPYVILHPGSGGSCPAWPVHHFVRLAALLTGEGVPVVVSVGPDDRAVARALDEAPPEVRKLPRITGGIAFLAACEERSAAVVSNSTGPLHLAAALGTSTLAFHAPWESCGVDRWGPYAENGWALVADLEEARRWTRKRRLALGGELLASISPASALECALALVEGAAPELPNPL